MKNQLANFESRSLDGDGSYLLVARLPDELIPDKEGFETLWQLHPPEFYELQMYGRGVKTPRWQQAFGMDYRYTGRINHALPTPPFLEPFLEWSRANIDSSLNGLLLNWYDGTLGHYIGRHRDSTSDMIPGSPIVTISLGEERTFRLRKWPNKPGVAPVDIRVISGTVLVMPWETNQRFTHEVPRSVHQKGRRISITLRGFNNPVGE